MALGPLPLLVLLLLPGGAFSTLRQPLSEGEVREFYRRLFAERAREYSSSASGEEGVGGTSSLYHEDADLRWVDAPGAWHQQTARIVDHRFKVRPAPKPVRLVRASHLIAADSLSRLPMCHCLHRAAYRHSLRCIHSPWTRRRPACLRSC